MFRFLAVAFVLIVSSAGAQEAKPVEALDGLDPVLLVQGKEVFGKAEFSVARGGFEYKFASAETKDTFARAPEKFEIQLEGLCARMGGTATGNPSDYVVHEGRIYIFGSDECHKRFVAAPSKYLPRPVATMDSSAAALSRGKALVEKAVQALGGAERLDAVATYVETSTQTQRRGENEAVIASRAMWKFPAGARLERRMTMSDRQMQSANVLSPSGAWFVGGQDVYPVGAAARPALEREFGREIVPLLRGRTASSFKASAISGDSVRIRNGAVDITLTLDASSGRILRATYVDRHPEGEYGEWVIAYSDFRPVAGLSLPFSRQAQFNGAPEPSRTRAIETIAINEPLDDQLFAPSAARR